MSPVEIVAASYGQSVEDVRRWPTGVISAFHRNAIARGYITTAAA